MDDQEKYDAYAEAVRLIHKFFPESRTFFSVENGIAMHRFIYAMGFCGPESGFLGKNKRELVPDLSLNRETGVYDDDDVVFDRLLVLANLSPTGRVVIIPDMYSEPGWAKCPEVPFICDRKMARQRLNEIDSPDLFEGIGWDSLFVFESGEAMALDRDNRFFWAKSKKNRFGKTAENNG
jgi:hypothetical protein